ncbi:unnamed protein product, partial [marine sediment metagenome]
IVFKHKVAVLDLPCRMVTEEDLRFAKEKVELHKKNLAQCDQNPASLDFSFNYHHIGYFQEVIDRYEKQKTST